MDRRKFLATGASAAAAGLGELGFDPQTLLAAPGERKVGTCGPPPRKNPERQTSAESIPPLPLPATPLRRSEPKAEPTPPMFMGKLEYGTTQDWNTDPGDADNLMRHVRSALGLWYGWKKQPLTEVVAAHRAGKDLKLPCLYISGHEAFEFSAEERQALERYLYEGGTLVGDACCGRSEFAQAFRREISRMFPERDLARLEMDHPLFRSFFKYESLAYRRWANGAKSEFDGPPEIEGMNLGCRTAVIFSPADMSCGWDNHTHEHGFRILPDHAIKLGINLISYIAALRPVAESQAVTREIEAPVSRLRHKFALAQLRHHGDWNPDPNSTYQWLRNLAAESSLAVSFELKTVDAVDTQIAAQPFLYLTGFRNPRLSNAEIEALRRHLQAGGFLFINNCSGYNAFDRHARELIKRLFPDQELTRLKSDHAILRALHTVKQGRDRSSNSPRDVELEGIAIRQRLVLVYSKNDMITQMKQVSDPFGNGYDADTCRKLAVNLIAYAMQN